MKAMRATQEGRDLIEIEVAEEASDLGKQPKSVPKIFAGKVRQLRSHAGRKRKMKDSH